jgi:hypothetical protein
LRSAPQAQVALFNTEGPATSLTRNFGRLARSTSDTAVAAPLLAVAYVVNADVMLACFEAKYFYNAWRPPARSRAPTKTTIRPRSPIRRGPRSSSRLTIRNIRRPIPASPPARSSSRSTAA